jgi:S1-C subfamily serine protease
LRGGDQLLDIDGQQVQVGGDVIIAFDSEPVTRFEDLKARLQQAQPGQEVILTLLRDGQEAAVEVTLDESLTSVP